MGCDVHMYCERLVGDTWIPLKAYSRWHDEHPSWGPLFDYEEWYSDRNYELFGILAGVRRDPGPVSFGDPKGLPYDVSALVKERSDYWDIDGHSHSYITLKSLIEFEWDKRKLPMGGIVDQEVADRYHKDGTLPYSWCGWASNMDGKVHLEWEAPAKDYCRGFIKLIEDLKTLGDPETVRIVFWFDN